MITTKRPLSEMSEQELHALLSACLYDNLRRSDVYDRSKSEEHKALLLKNMEETEFLIARIRFEIHSREEA
jgi:hypothetical protein